ncbi:MAG TPA: hypothetical protein VEX69_10785 [Candidatus Limnocylindria bacterium]|nr:hypothetical protein [Candidatus Limnocylindria bacterium]
MNDPVALFLRNPELIRNLRIQMRPKRMAVAAGITAIVSLIILPALWPDTPRGTTSGWGMGYLGSVLLFQSVTVLVGGGIACLQSISREKELNTFDYQRITRLSPLELTMGKLLGAPSMAYFIGLCLIPSALLALPKSGWNFGDLLDAWILLFFGAIAFHAFTVLMSMVLRRSLSTGAVLLFLFFAGFPGMSFSTIMLTRGLHGVGGSQSINFYGIPVPFTPFFCFVYASFAAWFILALERNIKRDPAMYELLTPLQALGFAGWTNFLFIGSFPLAAASLYLAQISSLWVNVTVFSMLGLILLRNRDRARRRLRELGAQGLTWLEAFWPAPYILVGVLVTGFLPLLLVSGKPNPPASVFPHTDDLNMSLFLFRLVFIGLWLCRDLLYLQWMYLRPGRKPLLRGILYACVYYTALFVLFFVHSAMNLQPGEAAFQSIFVPVRVLTMDIASWNTAASTWFIALLSQIALMYFFAFLHRQELQSLATRPKTYPSAAPPAMRPGAPAVVN